MREELPHTTPVTVEGIPEQLSHDRYRYTDVTVRGSQTYREYASTYGSSVLVGNSLPRVELEVPASARGPGRLG